MKFALLFVLVAVAAVSATEVEDPTSSSRSGTLNLGVIGANDRLLRNLVVTRSALATSQALNVRYTAPAGMRVIAIRVREVGVSQFATVRRISGGLFSNFITLQFVNSPRRGFHFSVQIWGR